MQDLINDENEFYNFEEFKQKYQFNTNFLEFYKVINILNTAVKHVKEKKKVENPFLSFDFRIFFKSDKRSRDMYNVFIKHKNNSSQPKWSEKFSMNEKEWKIVNTLPFFTTKNSYLQWFQYRINQNILPTNKLLTQMKIKQNDKCTFCKTFTETIYHLFWECQIVNNFWNELLEFLNENIQNTEMNGKEALFGILKLDKKFKPINYLYITFRNYIYKQKCNEKSLVLNNFLKVFKYNLEIERMVSI